MKWIYYPIIFATVVGSFQFIAQAGCGSPPEHGRCADDFCCPGVGLQDAKVKELPSFVMV